MLAISKMLAILSRGKLTFSNKQIITQKGK
jgi:hypothetical protein